jgi:hypothetical protein
MDSFDPKTYGASLADLLGQVGPTELGPGQPAKAARSLLEAADIQAAMGDECVDPEMAACCQSGLWLAFGYLGKSHDISQEIHTPAGSYWHAIMHRREPDASNAKYWFRKVGDHESFEPLAEAVSAIAPELLGGGASWDPFAFVDACERSRGRGDAPEALCRSIQLLEWQILFDHCYVKAKGR